MRGCQQLGARNSGISTPGASLGRTQVARKRPLPAIAVIRRALLR
jgi:hypothetical protein